MTEDKKMTDVRTQDAPTAAQEKRGPNPPGSFIWYELMTTDAEGAKDFYDAVIGWDIAPPHDSSGYRMIQRSDGGSAGGVLPVTQEMQQHGARSAWHGYLNVADIHDSVRRIEGAGGRILMGPQEIDHVGPIAMVTDPQGAPFYVMRPNPPKDEPGARSDVYSREAPQRVAWNELMTSNQNGALDFYLGQFGWTKGEAMPMGEMGTYQLLNHDGDTIGAIMTEAADKPSRWRFYIRVDDVDRAKSTIESKGGTVVHGPMEVPGGDRVLIGIDPQGAEFALVGNA
jgi:predicted enzyme related to lactoylglutathione lyase